MIALPEDLAVIITQELSIIVQCKKDVYVMRVLCKHYHHSRRILEAVMSDPDIGINYPKRPLRITLDIFPDSYWLDMTIRLPYKYTEKYKDKIHWDFYQHYHCFGEEEYDKYIDYIYWDVIEGEYQNFTEKMLEKYWEKVHKFGVSQFKGDSLSDEFVDKYGEDLDWKYVIKKKRPDALLERYIHKIDWWWVTKYDVSEEFYGKYRDFFFAEKIE